MGYGRAIPGPLRPGRPTNTRSGGTSGAFFGNSSFDSADCVSGFGKDLFSARGIPGSAARLSDRGEKVGIEGLIGS